MFEFDEIKPIPCKVCGCIPEIDSEPDPAWWGCGDPECCWPGPQIFSCKCECGVFVGDLEWYRRCFGFDDEDDLIEAWNKFNNK